MGEQARVPDRMVANGVVRPRIDARFTFEGIPEALAQLESGEIPSKGVVVIQSAGRRPFRARRSPIPVRYHEAPGGGGTVSGNLETMPWGRFHPLTVTPPLAGSSPTMLDAWDAHVTKRPDAPAVHHFGQWLVTMLVAWRDVEDALCQHPPAREACVVGVPDHRRETVEAFVSLVRDTSATPEELIDSRRVRMPVYEYPRRVEILDELPQNTSGKLLRRELRDQGAR